MPLSLVPVPAGIPSGLVPGDAPCELRLRSGRPAPIWHDQAQTDGPHYTWGAAEAAYAVDGEYDLVVRVPGRLPYSDEVTVGLPVGPTPDLTEYATQAELDTVAALVGTQATDAELVAAIATERTSERARQDTAYLSKVDAGALYVAKNRLRAGIISGQLQLTDTAFPAVTTDLPTVSYSAAPGTLTGRRVVVTDDNVRYVSPRSTFDVAANRWKTPQPTTIEFILLGPDVELRWLAAGNTGTDVFWWWVDGKPITALPATSGQVTSLGTGHVTKLTFPDSKPRRITCHFRGVSAVNGLNVATTTAISAPPVGLPALMVGDSFFAGPLTIADAWSYCAAQIARRLGVECANIAEGGIGYKDAVGPSAIGVFHHPDKVAWAAEYDPAFIVISGSVNDDTETGIEAAATACYDAYAAACPGVPIIVFGPQPNGAGTTGNLSAERVANVVAVKAAAEAHPAVIAFHDMIGVGDGLPAAWNSATTYNTGDRVTYVGSVWEWTRPTSAANIAPNAVTNTSGWGLVTYLYTGTGKVGATAGDGTRDVLLDNDGIHPTLNGATALAARQASEIRADLIAFAFA